jgi:hypothetical protein
MNKIYSSLINLLLFISNYDFDQKTCQYLFGPAKKLKGRTKVKIKLHRQRDPARKSRLNNNKSNNKKYENKHDGDCDGKKKFVFVS